MNALLAALVLAGLSPQKPSAAPAPTAVKPAADPCEGEHAAKEAKADDTCHHPSNDPAGAATSTEEVVIRGDKLKGLPAVELAALMKTPTDFDGKTVALQGTVRKACEKKGCWMELATARDAKGPGVRVTFKDYGFFVPLDSAGRKAQVEGTVKVAELSEERAKHYESEGAIVPRGKDGKAREIQLVALGVELRK